MSLLPPPSQTPFQHVKLWKPMRGLGQQRKDMHWLSKHKMTTAWFSNATGAERTDIVAISPMLPVVELRRRAFVAASSKF